VLKVSDRRTGNGCDDDGLRDQHRQRQPQVVGGGGAM
jgi:hypothetical protein